MSRPGQPLLQSALWLLYLSCMLSSLVVAQTDASDVPSDVQRYAEAGQNALARGHYEEAEKAYEKLRELEPGVAEVHANLGLIYFQERKFKQAVPALSQALKLKPALPKTSLLLAMSLSELSRYGEALPGLEKGFHQATDPAIKRMCGLQLLRTYTGLRRDNKAVEVALELNRLYPDDPEVLYHTGKIFGNFAFLNMQKLAQVAPASVWRHQAEAEASESQGSYDAAIGEYRQVLSVDPRRPGVHYRLGRSLLARSRQNNTPDDIAAASKEFEQELELDPGNANAAYELAEIHRNAGEFDLAQKFFEQALTDYPDFAEAHLGLAAVFMSMQKPGLALRHLQQAVSLNSENEVAWYRLSQVQGLLGQGAAQKKAFAEFQRLRAQKSTQQEAAKQIFSPEEVTQQKLDPK
jgi:tetratricopeptide (TPR) repeat protein